MLTICIYIINSKQNPKIHPKTNEIKLIDSSELKHTVFTPVLDIKIDSKENFIYCSSFQAAWNNFRSEVFKDTLEISAADSAKIIMKLEEGLSQKATLDDEYHVSLAGRNEIVAKINTELMKKFKTNHFDAEIKTDEVLIYSRFKKTYSLEYPLDDFLGCGYDNLYSRIGQDFLVEGFGFQDSIVGDKSSEIKISQIELLYCKADRFWSLPTFRDTPFCYPEGIVLQFKLKGSDDEFIMATDEFITHTNDTENTLLKIYYKINDLATNKKFNYFNLSVFYESNYINEEFFGSNFLKFSEKVKKLKIEDLHSNTKQEYLEKFRVKAGLDETEFKMLCKYIDAMDERMDKYINPLHRAFSLKIPKFKLNFSVKYPLFNGIIGHKYKFIHEIDAQFKFSEIPDALIMYDNSCYVHQLVIKPILYIKKKNEKLPYLMACINNYDFLIADDYYTKNIVPKLKIAPEVRIYIGNKPVWYYKILNKDEFIDRD